ncbi:MAG: efflux RND transporter periplasmic adaptor subunit [Rhizobiales bacterium]|nr:efflux RND transporter periplasmic adaptor subunit [Hyphomicrobiales bacterium]
MAQPRVRFTVVALLLALALLPAACGDSANRSAGTPAAEADYERGPHRGRMLRDGDFAVEITIFEEGTDPEFRVYPYWQNKPLDPSKVDLRMVLTRLGGRADAFSFTPNSDFLMGSGIVKEPHSFDVAVTATYSSKESHWTYDSYEGRTIIADAVAEASGVKTAPAGDAVMVETIDLPGRVTLQPQGRAEVRAWYPGRIIEMTKSVGQQVQKGELLVRVEASDSLRTYQINSPITGVVTERNANVGDVASQAIYVVTDATKVQATLFAFPRDAERLEVGQPVEIEGLGGQRIQTRIVNLLPSADPSTQTVSALAELPNLKGIWRPGIAIEATVTLNSTSVPLAVKTRALQRFRDFTVVFAKVGDTYEVRMLKLGRRTPEWTEVLGGIDPGEVYVTDNAFLIRADIEKSGASHDH